MRAEPGTQAGFGRWVSRLIWLAAIVAAIQLATDYFSHIGETEVFPVELVEGLFAVALSIWAISFVLFCMSSLRLWAEKDQRRRVLTQAVGLFAVPATYLATMAFLMLLDQLSY